MSKLWSMNFWVKSDDSFQEVSEKEFIKMAAKAERNSKLLISCYKSRIGQKEDRLAIIKGKTVIDISLKTLEQIINLYKQAEIRETAIPIK